MFRNLDIFPKAIKTDLNIKTSFGGLLSIISMVYLLYNLYFEFQEYNIIKSVDKLSVSDMNLPKTIPYYLDVTIFRECDDLHFDILNQKRTFEIEAVSNTSFDKEGGFCRMKSRGTIPSVPGSMHIGLGKNYEQNGQHRHLHITLYNKNLSHRINQFRYGELELDSPLHQTSLMLPKADTKLYMLTYQIQLVPVVENEKIGFQLLADLTKTNIDKIRSNGIPAILFEWDFSPLQLRKTTEKTPLIILISHLLGVFGSFFMFVRWFDSLVFGSNTYKYVKL